MCSKRLSELREFGLSYENPPHSHNSTTVWILLKSVITSDVRMRDMHNFSIKSSLHTLNLTLNTAVCLSLYLCNCCELAEMRVWNDSVMGYSAWFQCFPVLCCSSCPQRLTLSANVQLVCRCVHNSQRYEDLTLACTRNFQDSLTRSIYISVIWNLLLK